MARCGKKCEDSTHGVDADGKIFQPNPELNLEKQHKDWYHPDTMGKQRGKPQYDMKEQKKSGKDWKKK